MARNGRRLFVVIVHHGGGDVVVFVVGNSNGDSGGRLVLVGWRGCGGVGIDGERWGLGRKKMDYLFILLVFYLSFLIILFEKLRLPSCPFEID